MVHNPNRGAPLRSRLIFCLVSKALQLHILQATYSHSVNYKCSCCSNLRNVVR